MAEGEWTIDWSSAQVNAASLRVRLIEGDILGRNIIIRLLDSHGKQARGHPWSSPQFQAGWISVH